MARRDFPAASAAVLPATRARKRRTGLVATSPTKKPRICQSEQPGDDRAEDRVPCLEEDATHNSAIDPVTMISDGAVGDPVTDREYAVLLNDVTTEELEGAVAQRFGLEYLGIASAEDPLDGRWIEGIYFGAQRIIIPLVVESLTSFGDEGQPRRVYFIVDTGSPETFLEPGAWEMIGMKRNTTGMIRIGGQNIGASRSVEGTAFENVNILGMNALRPLLARIFLDTVGVFFGTQQQLAHAILARTIVNSLAHIPWNSYGVDWDSLLLEEPTECIWLEMSMEIYPLGLGVVREMLAKRALLARQRHDIDNGEVLDDCGHELIHPSLASADRKSSTLQSLAESVDNEVEWLMTMTKPKQKEAW